MQNNLGQGTGQEVAWMIFQILANKAEEEKEGWTVIKTEIASGFVVRAAKDGAKY